MCKSKSNYLHPFLLYVPFYKNNRFKDIRIQILWISQSSNNKFGFFSMNLLKIYQKNARVSSRRAIRTNGNLNVTAVIYLEFFFLLVYLECEWGTCIYRTTYSWTFSMFINVNSICDFSVHEHLAEIKKTRLFHAKV